jgi:integrase/recombinase XerD
LYKNVTLEASVSNGHNTYKLLNGDGSENLGFSIYRDGLLKKRRGFALTTIKSYLEAVAHFFDYLFEVALQNGVEIPTEDLILDAIECWDEYLVEGSLSDDEFVTSICEHLSSPRLSPSSSSLYHSALKHFLLQSEKIRKSLERLSRHGLIEDNPLLSKQALLLLPPRHKIPKNQRHKIVSNSMIAGVLAGGPKFSKPSLFPNIQGGDKDTRSYKDFPYDKIVDLLDALPNYRDKALYSFIAASGGRLHEALRILIEDIDLSARTVQLVNPNLRINDGHYEAFSTADRRIISTWKGRETQQTFLIEPFKSLFFEYAGEYWRRSKPHDVNHQFLFCCTDNDNWGKPFLFATPSSHRHGFNVAANKVLGNREGRGPHSLRHTYGFYLTNFCPNLDGGYGLNLSTVQTYMGHAEPRSTKRYCRTDEDRAQLELAYSNSLCYDINDRKSINEVKQQILLTELARVNQAIALENIA